MPLTITSIPGAPVLDRDTAELIARSISHAGVQRVAAAWLAAYRAARFGGADERVARVAGDAAWDRSTAAPGR